MNAYQRADHADFSGPPSTSRLHAVVLLGARGDIYPLRDGNLSTLLTSLLGVKTVWKLSAEKVRTGGDGILTPLYLFTGPISSFKYLLTQGEFILDLDPGKNEAISVFNVQLIFG